MCVRLLSFSFELFQRVIDHIPWIQKRIDRARGMKFFVALFCHALFLAIINLISIMNPTTSDQTTLFVYGRKKK